MSENDGNGPVQITRTGGTDYGRMVRDIEVYVRKKKTVTVLEIGNAVRGYSKKDRMAALTDLEELGKVHIGRIKGAGLVHLPRLAELFKLRAAQ
jgi:hypothetical protein